MAESDSFAQWINVEVFADHLAWLLPGVKGLAAERPHGATSSFGNCRCHIPMPHPTLCSRHLTLLFEAGPEKLLYENSFKNILFMSSMS